MLWQRRGHEVDGGVLSTSAYDNETAESREALMTKPPSSLDNAGNVQQIKRIRREMQPTDQEGSPDDFSSAFALVKLVA